MYYRDMQGCAGVFVLLVPALGPMHEEPERISKKR